MRELTSACVYGTAIVLIITLIFTPNFRGQEAVETPASPIPSTYNVTNVTIGMERNMCMGTCPVYSLEIFGNGTVIYYGDRFVNVTGKQISNISEDKVKELIGEFYKIHYFSLNDTYDKVIKTDQPTVITSININGTFKSIFDNLGAIAPEGLRVLEDKIDQFINSSKWIDPYVHPPGVPIGG